MRYILVITILVFINSFAFAQVADSTTADSLSKLTCKMTALDQKYRSSEVIKRIDSLLLAGDTVSAMVLMNKRIAIDSQNVITLINITKHYGFPTHKSLKVKKVCFLMTLLIHWSKSWPKWYNSPEIVTMFKQELDKGNMTLELLDAPHFFYISYMKADTSIMHLVNNARKTYGLTEYTLEQYTGKERAELLDGRNK